MFGVAHAEKVAFAYQNLIDEVIVANGGLERRKLEHLY
jgi:hypothetical protein